MSLEVSPEPTPVVLNTFTDCWPLLPELCPCDVDFIDWLEERKVRDAAIFHFGTGEHHTVGKHAGSGSEGNAVLGITASAGEYQAYIDLVTGNPQVARSYNVFFNDIYLLNPRLLPDFDVVTLFHLCEYRTEQNAAYGAMTDLELASMLAGKLKPGGTMLFYSGSLGFEEAKPIIQDLASEAVLERLPDFRSLSAYRKPS